jgi:hypothetical protein
MVGRLVGRGATGFSGIQFLEVMDVVLEGVDLDECRVTFCLSSMVFSTSERPMFGEGFIDIYGKVTINRKLCSDILMIVEKKNYGIKKLSYL